MISFNALLSALGKRLEWEKARGLGVPGLQGFRVPELQGFRGLGEKG